jgi:hypothetical protein
MRGFALSDSLMALAIVSLLFVVMLSRGPDLEAREAERRTEAFMFDAATRRSHSVRRWIKQVPGPFMIMVRSSPYQLNNFSTFTSYSRCSQQCPIDLSSKSLQVPQANSQALCSCIEKITYYSVRR